jgi:hypothetical protein
MSRRQTNAALATFGATILVDQNYTCAVTDGLVVVQAANVTVTLPPNPTVGTTVLEFSAEQSFSLTGGGNPLSGSDPLLIGAGSTFYAAFTAIGWLLSGIGQGGLKTAWTIAALFVDPLNSGGKAKDSNTGLDAAHPLLTTARVNQLLANKFINFASGLAFVGSPVTLRTSTLTAAQAIVPATNTRNRVTDASIANWAGDLANFFVDTAAANLNNAAPIMHDVAGGTHQADLGRTVTPGGAAGAIGAADTYAVKRGSNLLLGAITPTFLTSAAGVLAGASTITYLSDDNSGVALDLSTVELNGLTFTDFNFVTAGNLGSSIVDYVGTAFTRCIFQDNVGTFVSLNLNNIIVLNNCILVNGAATQLGAFIMNSGGTFSVITGIFLGLSGDTFFEHANLNINTLTLLAVQITPGIGAGVQIQDVPFLANALQVFTDADLGGRIWGSGNTGPGIVIFPGATARVSAATPPVLTGAGGDFRFIQQNGQALVGVGRAFDPATGEYTEIGGVATRTCTWAHFAATLAAGGFNFQAHNPETGARIVGL